MFMNEFETVGVIGPSVFEPLKFYCICYDLHFLAKSISSNSKFSLTYMHSQIYSFICQSSNEDILMIVSLKHIY